MASIWADAPGKKKSLKIAGHMSVDDAKSLLAQLRKEFNKTKPPNGKIVSISPLEFHLVFDGKEVIGCVYVEAYSPPSKPDPKDSPRRATV